MKDAREEAGIFKKVEYVLDSLVCTAWNLGVSALAIYAVWVGRSVWWLMVPVLFYMKTTKKMQRTAEDSE